MVAKTNIVYRGSKGTLLARHGTVNVSAPLFVMLTQAGRLHPRLRKTPACTVAARRARSRRTRSPCLCASEHKSATHRLHVQEISCVRVVVQLYVQDSCVTVRYAFEQQMTAASDRDGLGLTCGQVEALFLAGICCNLTYHHQPATSA